jgi:hypothetical protein
MKRTFASNVKLHVLLATLSLVLAGCTHTLRLRAVDAATKEPLSGVNTRWTQVRYGMFIRAKQEGPTNLPASGQDGMIVVGGLHSSWLNWHNYFAFSCSGFSNVYGIYEGPPLGLGERIFKLDGELKDAFILEGNLTSIFQSNGCYVIPMQK